MGASPSKKAQSQQAKSSDNSEIRAWVKENSYRARSACGVEGNEFCSKVLNAKGCLQRVAGSFMCKCAEGHVLTFTGSSPTCKSLDTCGSNHGGCHKKASCIKRERGKPLCKCFPGYKGGTEPGSRCQDVNECLDTVSPPCGTEEQNAICTNTVGSYECKCKKGYEGTGYKGDCTPIPFCADRSLNRCDPLFANCLLKDGSYECKCKDGFEGSGAAGACRVPEGGDPNKYCEVLEIPCDDYQICTLMDEESGEFQCLAKPGAQQLQTFFTKGPTSSTPTWVWIVVGLAAALFLAALGFLIHVCVRRSKKKKSLDETMEQPNFDYGSGRGYRPDSASSRRSEAAARGYNAWDSRYR